MPDQLQDWFTVREAAQRLHISERWLRELIRRGDIKTERKGWTHFISLQTIEDYERRKASGK